MPRSLTPAGPQRQTIRAVPYFLALRCCLPLFQRRRLPRTARFRGCITRPARSLSTLRGHGCPCAAYGRARLASGWWPTLAGQDLNLLGPIAKFQPVLRPTWHPPHPGLAWRTRTARGARLAMRASRSKRATTRSPVAPAEAPLLLAGDRRRRHRRRHHGPLAPRGSRRSPRSARGTGAPGQAWVRRMPCRT